MYYLTSPLCTITAFKFKENSSKLKNNFQAMCRSHKIMSYCKRNCSSTNLKLFQTFIHKLIQGKRGLHLVHAVQKVHSHVCSGQPGSTLIYRLQQWIHNTGHDLTNITKALQHWLSMTKILRPTLRMAQRTKKSMSTFPAQIILQTQPSLL